MISTSTSIRPADSKGAPAFRVEHLKVWLRNLWHWRTKWAVSYLSKQLQADPEFRNAWHANIAMPIYDAIAEDRSRTTWAGNTMTSPTSHSEFCNNVADRLMKHLFGA